MICLHRQQYNPQRRFEFNTLLAGQHGLRSLPSEVIHAIALLSRERSL